MRVLCPDLAEHEALNGQLLEVEVSALTDTVGDMKVRAVCCWASRCVGFWVRTGACCQHACPSLCSLFASMGGGSRAVGQLSFMVLGKENHQVMIRLVCL